jgi:hypothetical protein
MQTYSESKGFNVNFVTIQAYPVSDFASSADLQFQTITGDSEFRCAVSPDHSPYLFCFCATGSHQFSSSGRSWAKSSAKVHHGHIGTTREIPLQNGKVLGMPLRIG